MQLSCFQWPNITQHWHTPLSQSWRNSIFIPLFFFFLSSNRFSFWLNKVMNRDALVLSKVDNGPYVHPSLEMRVIILIVLTKSTQARPQCSWA